MNFPELNGSLDQISCSIFSILIFVIIHKERTHLSRFHYWLVRLVNSAINLRINL